MVHGIEEQTVQSPDVLIVRPEQYGGTGIMPRGLHGIVGVCTVVLLLIVLPCVVRAADDVGAKVPADQARNDWGPMNTFTVGIGRAHDITGDDKLSNLGFDYLRRFSPSWEWGIQLDLDWERDFIQFEGVSVAGIVAYSITAQWPVFGGVGVAGEEDHNIMFLRVGTEYTFYLDKKNRYFLAPGTFLDTDKEGTTLSVMVVLGIFW